MRIEPAAAHAAAIIATLRHHRVLGAADDTELQTLLRRCQVVSAASREWLFREGDEGRSAVVILHGYVKLCVTSANGRETLLEVCGPGSMFGELAVLNEWPRSASAIALSPCQVLSVQGEAFRSLLVRSPEAMFAMMRVLSRRLREATGHMRDGTDLPGPARLAKALSHLAMAHAEPVENGLRIEVQLSQRELGAMTGLSRETINKQLGAWRDNGWLALVDGQLTLLDVEALRTLAVEGQPFEP